MNPNCGNGIVAKLNVHHIDYNKKNSIAQNLITLCSLCHGKTNSNRDWYQPYYEKIIINSVCHNRLHAKQGDRW